MARIKLLGTSHVSSESVEQIKHAIDTLNPDFVCVELDRARLDGIRSGKKSLSPKLMFHIGVGGYIFLLFGSLVQRTLAKKMNLVPGADMITAVEYAKGRKVALIDQPVHITLRRVSAVLKFRMICKMMCQSVFGKKRLSQEFELDSLTTVPKKEIVDKLVAYMKAEYPKLHNVLLDERNKYMVDRIKKITTDHPESTLLVVVGAAHVSGMKELLSK